MLVRRSGRAQQLLDDWALEQYAGREKLDQDALNNVCFPTL